MLTLSSFAAAHDSLQQRVAQIRTRTESLQFSFTATQGSFGGLHRKVKSYAGTPPSISATGEVMRALVVRQQTVKHRYGIKLEKLVYRDIKGRKVMTERYEGHQLTRLELFEYKALLSSPASRWLLVRGDYLSYSIWSVSMAYKSKRREVFFFRALPAGQ